MSCWNNLLAILVLEQLAGHFGDSKLKKQDDVEVSEEPDTCFAMKVIFQVFDSIDPAVL